MCRNGIKIKHLLVLYLLAGGLLVSCNQETKQSAAAETKPDIETHRKQVNDRFSDWENSPLPKQEIAQFKGLDYFSPNEKYAVKATFKRVSGEKPFAIPATNDTSYVYVKYGELHFEVNGTACSLSVYQSPDIISQPGNEDYLFIPFTDLTNGKESYGGGRYLDFRIPKTDAVTLDFNYAYNPYCAYNPKGFYCPIPPAENRLEVRIEAGEKTYRHQ